MSSLLYKNSVEINDNISVVIPNVGTVIDNENEYYGIVSMITATPYDMMAQLDECDIDFTQINDYELFLLLFNIIKERDTSCVFGDLDISSFDTMLNNENQTVVLKQRNGSVVIDRSIHTQICSALRRINHFERVSKNPANDEAKKYMIERARKKLRRHKKKAIESQLEPLIVALVNTEQFKYNFESVRDISIYQFNESLHQIIKKVDFDNRMHGIYAGTVSAKDISQEDLNWLTHK